MDFECSELFDRQISHQTPDIRTLLASAINASHFKRIAAVELI